MAVEWDEEKRLRILAERGFDLRDIVDALADPNGLTREDSRRNYGEQRYIMLAVSSGRLYNIVFTIRDGNIRIVTAFKANTREQRRYAYNC